MPLKVIRVSDKRKRGLISDWKKWLSKSEKLYLRYLDEHKYSLFEHHEISCVSLLAAGAALAGYLPICEYEVFKEAAGTGTDLDVPAKAGRADLWFSAGDRYYSFEFKRSYFSSQYRDLEITMEKAISDISRIPEGEYRYAASGMISLITEESNEDIFRDFCFDRNVDIAYRIGPEGPNGAYLYFKIR